MAVVFALFVLVELWSPIVHGGWFMPGDIGQMWTITRLAGVPVQPHNGLPGDVYQGLVPYLRFDISHIQAGHLPLWNPYDGNGQPFLANGQSAVFSPFTAVYYVFGLRIGLVLVAALKLWLAGFGTYLLLRRHRLGDAAAVVGGALFAYAGFHLVWLDYQDIVSVSALLPWALLAVRAVLDRSGDRSPSRRRRRLAVAGLAAVVGAMGLSGQPEVLTFDGLLVVAYAAFFLVVEDRPLRERLKTGARLVGSGVLGLSLAAAALLPLEQYEGSSGRALLSATTESQVVPGFPAYTLPIVAFPNLFGGPQFTYDDAALYGRYERSNYAEVTGVSVGLLGVCLAPLGLAPIVEGMVRRRRRRRRPGDATRDGPAPAPTPVPLAWFALAGLVVDGLLLYDRTVGGWWWHIPRIGAAVLNRSQDIGLLCLATLAAVGLHWVLDAGRGQRTGRLAALGAGSVVVGAGMVLWAHQLRSSLHATGTAAAEAVVHGNLEFETAAVAGLVVVVAAGTALRPVWARDLVLLGAGALAFCSNGLVMRSYNTTVPSTLVYPRTPAARAVQKLTRGELTVFPGSSFPWPDTNLAYGLSDVGSFDPLDEEWQVALYTRVFGTVDQKGPDQAPSCLAGLQTFGVQYVVGSSGPFAADAAGPGGSGQSGGSAGPGGSGGVVTGTVAGVPYASIPDSGPVALVGDGVTVPGDGTALRIVSSCGFDPNGVVVLDPSAFRPDDRTKAPKLPSSAAPAGRFRVVERDQTSMTVTTSATRPSWLLVRQTWAPGWSATVDGRPATVHRADVAFQAVRVPAGRHVVVLRYAPAVVPLGEGWSLAALVVLLVLLVAARRPGRRRPMVPDDRREAVEEGPVARGEAPTPVR